MRLRFIIFVVLFVDLECRYLSAWLPTFARVFLNFPWVVHILFKVFRNSISKFNYAQKTHCSESSIYCFHSHIHPQSPLYDLFLIHKISTCLHMLTSSIISFYDFIFITFIFFVLIVCLDPQITGFSSLLLLTETIIFIFIEVNHFF